MNGDLSAVADNEIATRSRSYPIDPAHRSRCLAAIGVDPFVVWPEMLLRQPLAPAVSAVHTTQAEPKPKQATQRSVQTLSALKHTESLLNAAPLTTVQKSVVSSTPKQAEAVVEAVQALEPPFFVLHGVNQLCWFALVESSDLTSSEAVRRQSLFNALMQQFGTRLYSATESPALLPGSQKGTVCFRWPPVSQKVLTSLDRTASSGVRERCIEEYLPAAAAVSINAAKAQTDASRSPAITLLFAGPEREGLSVPSQQYVGWDKLAGLDLETLESRDRLLTEIDGRIVVMPALDTLLAQPQVRRRMQLLLVLLAVAAGLRETALTE